MCGVVVCRLKHRGPDWSGLYQHEGNFLAQQRLAVVSPLSGDQPLYNEDRTVVVVVRDTDGQQPAQHGSFSSLTFLLFC
jgi:hypothetical protein